MLAELIAPLGLAVGWVGLAAQLRRSNLTSTVAREEERRRLRRDFHDGLGPALTGVSLGLRTAVRQLERSPNAACLAVPRELLDRIADEVDALIEEVKRIARDLRPTALDQFGLAAAVSELTRSFGEVLEFRLSLPDTAIDLPAAVEVATYRIVSEAVTNVVRHAHASCCWLTIAVDDDVDIDVSDDGVGIAASTAGGVGWAAMRERAIELGGVCSIESRESSGTRVHVRLPLVVA
jgi:signal transduction histidine kinase